MDASRTVAVGIAILFGCIAALVTTPPAGAATATFGANLASVTPNNTASANCAQAPPQRFYPTNSPSCMWSYINNSADTLTAPASGTVTAVRVKVGTTTGKMRVNVIRFLFQQTGDAAHPNTAGPYLEAYGPEFTPRVNDITQVATSLVMREDPTPPVNDTQTIQVIDALALEVEDSTTPIPVFVDTGSTLSYPVYPGPTAAGVPAPSPNALPTYTTLGYGVELNADLTTAGAATPAPTPSPSPTPNPTPGTGMPNPLLTPAPTVALGRTTIPVTNGVAPITLQCQVANCAGLLTLQNAGATARTATGTAAAKKTVSYGSARFSAGAGKSATVRVKLNPAGRALLKRRRSVTVLARVTFTSGGGAAKAFRVTLKR